MPNEFGLVARARKTRAVSKSSHLSHDLSKDNFSHVLSQKATNGQVNLEKTSPVKKTAVKAEAAKRTNAKGDDSDSKLRENKHDDNKIVARKEKEQPATKAGKENKMEQVKNKKNLKNLYQEKPVDFDDGSLICISTAR